MYGWKFANHVAPELQRQFADMPPYAKIILRRDNHLRQYVSLRKAHQTTRWKSDETFSKTVRLRAAVIIHQVFRLKHHDARRNIKMLCKIVKVRLGLSRVPEKVTIHMDAFRHYAETTTAYYQALYQVFGKDAFTISYEELVGERKSDHLKALQDFLSLPIEPLASKMHKQSTRPLSHSIANYAQLAEQLRQTEYAWMLEE